MNKDRLERLESHLPSSIEHAVKDVDKSVHDFSQHIKPSHWHPISTAPYNQEFELRINENGEIATLEFPCLHTNEEAWINVDLGTEIKIQPVEWRLWQREKSLEPHHSKIKPSDRSALFRHDRPHTQLEIGKVDQ
jgi:hypothetical protein